MVPQEKTLLRHGQPPSIDRPNISSTFSIFRFSDIWASQYATKSCSSTSLSDVSISGRAGNTLDGLLKSKCSLHLATFRVRTLNKTEQQDALAMTFETFKVFCLQNTHTNLTPMITLPSPDVTSSSSHYSHVQ